MVVLMSDRSDIAVSVIIPVYNAESFLRACLESIVSQTLHDLEIICVDDSSTDKSLEILKEFEKVDTRVRVITQKHEGAGAARNKGLRIASGKYLSFLDADDYFERDMLEKMFLDAERYTSDIVICRTSMFSDEAPQPAPDEHSVRFLKAGHAYTQSDLQDRAFHFCVGWPWDKLFRRTFILEHGLEFQHLMSTNDAYFVYVALLLARSLSFVDSYLVYHRIGNAGSIENRRDSTWSNAFSALDSIEQRLRQEDLYERYEGAFLGWAYDFCLWNFETLTGASKEAFCAMMRERILPRIEEIDREHLVCDYELNYLDMFMKPHVDLLQEHISSYWKIRYLEEEVEVLQKRISFLEGEAGGYEQSVSYRIGKTITAIPRAIRNRIETKGDSKNKSVPSASGAMTSNPMQ
jgi:glycosyltransferase involved in cell wall biosynthesis